jgi:hypothetical protein
LRDKRRTIEALRRLAERPGTPQEGETARRKLREMEADMASKVPLQTAPLWGDRVRTSMSPDLVEALKKNEEAFKRDLNNFFRNAGYVPRREPKSAVISWEDMEGAIRRNIYKNQGDPE